MQDVYNNGKFDLIILENLGYPLFNSWKDHFQCPLIGIASLDLWIAPADDIGNPSFPSYYVDFQKPAGKDLNFWERLDNFLYSWEIRWGWYNEIIPMKEALIKKIYGTEVDASALLRNFDLVLVNTNSIFHLPRPLVPAYIPISGIHTHQQKPLPQVNSKDFTFT